jgi:hypothetical protein
MHSQKFIVAFIEFIKEHFDFDEHLFIITDGPSGDMTKILQYENVIILDNNYNSKYNYLKYSSTIKPYAEKADKIILHAIFSDNKLCFLYFNQDLLSKSYWVIWGADLYVYNKPRTRLRDQMRHYIRTKVYSKIGHFITYIKSDYKLVQKWYSANGEYHECFMYPSNLYKECDIKSKAHSTINIQLGNSADPSNNHIEVLEKLIVYKDKDIKIYTPLSYGSQEYAKEVILKGKELFADKFIPLIEFIPFEKYLEFLSSMDIAIFAHKRQQAMGNIITLLGLGKKVYMRSDITPWQLFAGLDVKVFDVKNIEINSIDKQAQKQNQQRIKEYFSEENYLKQN